MKISNRVKLMVAAVTVLSITPAWGQEKAHAQHDEKKPAELANDAKAKTQPKADVSKADASKEKVSAIDHSTMDHGDMKMQGGSAPADARDPHASSGGYTLESMPYAQPGPRQLRLADEHNVGSLLFDRLERVYTNDGNATSYEAQAWFGRNYNRLVLKAEGEIADGKVQEASTEVLWGHAVDTYWNTQLGARFDTGSGLGQEWLALGIQGLAPYWFEIDATAYVSNNGRTALSLSAEYELLLTQKLVLQPRVEINYYGKSDAARDIGRGLSDGALGVRLRYEFIREFAPYLGVERASKFGDSAVIARAAGETTDETRWVAGLRFWY